MLRYIALDRHVTWLKTCSCWIGQVDHGNYSEFVKSDLGILLLCQSCPVFGMHHQYCYMLMEDHIFGLMQV